MDALVSGMAGPRREVVMMAEDGRRQGRDMGDGDPVCTLWFAGGRPDADAIGRVLATLSPANMAQASEAEDAIAFAYDGFALRLRGLAPSAAIDADMPPHAFAADAVAIRGAEAVELVLRKAPADGADRPAAAVRALAEAALAVSSIGACVAIGWQPARSVMGCDYFARIMGDWLMGGAFPALGLVSLVPTAGESLLSTGLGAVCGQEVEIAPMAGMTDAERARVALRLIDHVARHGPLTVSDEVEISGFGRFSATLADEGKIINLTR